MAAGSLFELGKQASVSTLSESLTHLNRRGHAATAMMTTTRLENWLKEAIVRLFTNSPRRLQDKLFEFKGPLGTFSAKIDMAYAVGAISQDAHRTLHILRDIRNAFAHATDEMDFEDGAMDKHFAKLAEAGTRELAFLEAAVSVIQSIKEKMEPIFLADALQKYAQKSREKSR
ncbi:MAG: MltR family transcriptional regulator [Nitratireductor sp.]|uniref:MltR family transcriptional regulator n=1 Tax=Alphaproteobacteria TaxID=28211 RepID=UPI00326ADCB1